VHTVKLVRGDIDIDAIIIGVNDPRMALLDQCRRNTASDRFAFSRFGFNMGLLTPTACETSSSLS
jgi:hypothetical protein